ncbi:unnamed protein product, partial [Didymodactylos carnosus]
NFKLCQQITANHKLKEYFADSEDLLKIFSNYEALGYQDLTLFICFMVSFMHWGNESKLYLAETNKYQTIKLFGILRGESVTNKSGYIKLIRQAFQFVERYFQEKFKDEDGKIHSTFAEHLTLAKLYCQLEDASTFISGDEDVSMHDMDFFEPGSKRAKDTQPTYINAFNGIYSLLKGTMLYNKDIADRSLTLLCPTIGNCWSQILEYFSSSNATNGLYERILYWCISNLNFVENTLPLNENLVSLEQLFVIRMLIGFRVYEYETDAIAYLQPILKGLRLNRSPPQMRCIPSHNNKPLERRSADLIERIAFVIQNVFDVLKVLNGIEDLKFHTIAKETLTRIKENIQILYGKNDDDSNIDDGRMGYPNNIDLKDLAVVRITTVSKPPKKSMKITLAAVKAAVRIYDDLFYPQALHLFCSEPDNHQKEIGNLEHQHAILQTPFNAFSLSTLTRSGCIFHNHTRDKIHVYGLLADLVEKKFYHMANISMTPQILIADGFTEMEEIVLNGVDQSAVSKLNDENNTNGLSINDYTGGLLIYKALVPNCINLYIYNIFCFFYRYTSTLSNNIPLSDKTNTSSNSERTTFSTVRGVLSEKIKDICGKVLMIDSPLLSRTLLNRSISGHNMTDIHKACEVLIKMKLLSLKTDFLANKHSYRPCYLKLLPHTAVEEINFSMMLKDVEIKDIQ